MVYIFGGAFNGYSGDDLFLGPDFLIEHDVILVTLNHRVGMFGFLSLGTPEYSGNMGLKDQQLAIKWIYDNIEQFGGDKTKITLSGHSSGKLQLKKIFFSRNSYDFNINSIFSNQNSRWSIDCTSHAQRTVTAVFPASDSNERSCKFAKNVCRR